MLLKWVFFIGLFIGNASLSPAQASDDISTKHHPSQSSMQTLTIRTVEQAQQLYFDGQIEAVKAATVSAQTAGRILALHYDINDLVPAGSPLLEITSKEQGASFAAAEAELARAEAKNIEAQAQFTRYQALFPKGAISKGAMDEATANATASFQAVSAAKAQLITAKETLNYTTVSAPFSGRVTQRFVEQGETVTVGQPLYAGYAIDDMRAVFQLPQQYQSYVTTDTKVTIELASGVIIQSSDIIPFSFLQSPSQTYQIRVNLPVRETEYTAGEWVKIAISGKKQPHIIVPESAIFRRGDYTAVFMKQADNFVQTQVRVRTMANSSDNPSVIIDAGLMDGDIILAQASQFILQSTNNDK
ncbi:efflux RND transporter periplasmic adaptor subunit [Shewanella sp. MMG014]|uniref:efflux RND transporter periplasmic adaptor subunit n=1 Tax=Shewanella sp. MMG014 TaxID=2822691 RepID=UPI001B37D8B8|nr:efflux RND transporter periplasmic adaptor subunit [Shewanella sp. MMG014]MBQ4892220.1 efflux RND transporter periplasmic adaptor subunit [Shewanella sp. MMG014]